jgi:hypothetical protein
MSQSIGWDGPRVSTCISEYERGCVDANKWTANSVELVLYDERGRLLSRNSGTVDATLGVQALRVLVAA